MSRGCSAASRRFSAAYSAAASGVRSKRVAEREVPALPRASDLADVDVHAPRIAVVVPRAEELVLGLDGVDRCADSRAATSGSTMGSRGTSDATDTWMSMTGFAAKPGTDVEPDVVDPRTASVAERLAEALGLLRRTVPARRVVVHEAVCAGAPLRLAGFRPRPSPPARAGRTRRRSPAAPDRPRRCPPDATGRRASRRPHRPGRPRRARSPRPNRQRSDPSRACRRRDDRRLGGGGTST